VKHRVASLTSNIFNPFLIGLAIIFAISLESTSRVDQALRWSLVLVSVSMLPVLSAIAYLVRKGRLQGVLRATRGQRAAVYLLSAAGATLGYATLRYWDAPAMLQAAFAGGLAAVALFALINAWWKISIHTAFMAALATVLIILYGWAAVLAVGLVVLVGWARSELNHHSPAQATAGALLACAVVLVVFGLVGPE
jgi:membrane-associated phospholipid phosphatase